ncbi:DNA polymerase III subunit delta [Mycoplasma sp. HS2188]|uniref:DNA polymerase III subunit delta n=1 Tax=Mycoplasma sp. HS2188 TaxID=2976765 RepID=UPI0021AAD20B|nr:DNA polymerase III subunit delta [Mycoplasma sp. HS2188]MCT4469894.1 DNA polymerase III subunit delta [Mycoplasma sp. HS2188]
MYLIYGSEKYFINQYLKSILDSNKGHEVVNYYFNEENNVNDLIDIVAANNLFGASRIIVIYDCVYLEEKIKNNALNAMSNLMAALHANTQDIIIFINNNIEQKTKIVNNEFTNFLNKKDITLLYANSIQENELNKQIVQMVKHLGGNINNLAIEALLKKVPNDLYLINLELIKLINLNPNISVENIENTVSNIYLEDAFGFANSFEKDNFNLIWRKYKEKLNEGTQIGYLIGQLSQLLILADQIYCFSKAKKSLIDVANELKLNQYRVKKVYGLLNTIGVKRVHKMIKELAQLDRDIKNGKIDEFVGFENFLVMNFN